MAYDTVSIEPSEARRLRAEYADQFLYSAVSDINGLIVELNTGDRDHIDMWRDNFYSASERMRPHARLYCIRDDSEELHVEVDTVSSTAFLFNFDYYGWVKSVALGLSGLILEGSHGVFSVHGSAVSVDGVGTAVIAPSKTGKTTQSWGLLRNPDSRLISDDWFFVTLNEGRPRIRGSEKNCYIDADIGDVWEEFKPLVRNVKFDSRGRGIANVRWVTGDSSVISSCDLHKIVMLKRDPSDPSVDRPVSAEEALSYLESHDLCNPHQLIRDGFRREIRREFFAKLLSSCECHIVNTTLSARETQEIIQKIVKG